MKLYFNDFVGENRFVEIGNPCRSSLGELLKDHVNSIEVVRLNDAFTFLDDWKSYVPKNSDRLDIVVRAGTAAIPYIISAIISMALSMILSVIMSALAPKPKKPGRGRPSAGIAGLTNTLEAGTSIFTAYGEQRIFPHLIGSRTEISEQSRQRMEFSLLYCVGYTGGDGYEGMNDVEVNRVKMSNFPTLSAEIRLGELDQQVINGFENVDQTFYDGRDIRSAVEVQSIALGGIITGGTYTLTLQDNALAINGTTPAIQWNADAAGIQAALRTILGLEAVEVELMDGTTTTVSYSVKFVGTTGNVKPMTAKSSLKGKRPTIKITTLEKGNKKVGPPIVYSTRNQVDEVSLILMTTGLYSTGDDGSQGSATMKMQFERKRTSDPDEEAYWSLIPDSPIVWKGKSLAQIFKSVKVITAEVFLAFPNDIDDTAWVKTGLAFIAVDAGVEADSALIDGLVEDTSTGLHKIHQVSAAITADSTVIFQAVLKAGTRSWVRLKIEDSATSADNAYANFNLSTGLMGTTAKSGAASLLTFNLQPIGNLAYLCRVSAKLNATATLIKASVELCNADNVTSYTGSSGSDSSVYVGKVALNDGRSKSFWDFRAQLVSSNNEAGVPNLFNVVETQYTTRNYGGYALLALRGLASSLIQSLDSLQVSVVVRGKKVKISDGVGGYNLQWTDKRMWILRDILTHPLVGLGHRIPESMFDDAAAIVEQAYLDENAPGFGGVNEIRDKCTVLLSESRPGWDYIAEDVLSEVGGILVPSGGKFRPALDRPGSPGMMYQYPGNIIDDRGGPVRHVIALEHKSINRVRVAFRDAAKNYKASVRQWPIDDADLNGDVEKAQGLQLDTVCRASQALRIAQFELKRSKIVDRWRWRSPQEALYSDVYDLAYLSYDIVKNLRGYQGFCLSDGTTTTVILGRMITLEVGKTYDIVLRHWKTNVVEKRAIATGAGIVGAVTVTSAFSDAQLAKDYWAIGEQDVALKIVRIESITHGESESEQFALIGSAYTPSVYTVDALPASDSDGRVLEPRRLPPLPLRDAVFAEFLTVNPSGETVSIWKFDVTPGLALVGGTCQAGSTTTSIKLGAHEPDRDGFYNEAEFKIVSGTGAGQSGKVLSYDGATRTAVLEVALTTAPTATSGYQLRFKAFGTFDGFAIRRSSDLTAEFVEFARVPGEHAEISGTQSGGTIYFQFVPVAVGGIPNEKSLITVTAELSRGSAIAPPAPTSVTVNSILRQVTVESKTADPIPSSYAGTEIEIWKDPKTLSLLAEPDAFDNAAWTKTNLTITANQEDGPDGQATMDKLIETTADGNHAADQVSSVFTAGSSIVFEVFLKPGFRAWARLLLWDPSSTADAVSAYFDLTNGIAGEPVVGGVASLAFAEIAAYINGVYLCRIGCKLNGSATTAKATVRLAMRLGGGFQTDAFQADAFQTDAAGVGALTDSYVGTTAGYIFAVGGVLTVGGATINLVKSVRAGSISTDQSVPASADISSLANLLSQADAFDNAAWTKTNLTVTPDQDYDQAGALTIDKLVQTADTGVHGAAQTSAAITAGSFVTFEVFVKAQPSGGSATDWISILLENTGATNSLKAFFDIRNGIVGTTAMGGSGVGLATEISMANNGAYRCRITGKIDGSSTAVKCHVRVAFSSSSDSAAGNTGKFVFAGGARLVAGKFITALTDNEHVARHSEELTTLNYDDVVIARTRNVDYSDNRSPWAQVNAGNVLTAAAAEDSSIRTLIPIVSIESIIAGWPFTDADQMLSVGDSQMSTVSPGGGLVPPSDLIADIVPVTQVLFSNGSSGHRALHTIGEVFTVTDKYWKRIILPNLGKRIAITWDPPNNIADNTLYTAKLTNSEYIPESNDLLLAQMNTTFEITKCKPFPWYVTNIGGLGIRASLHTILNTPVLDSLVHTLWALRDPERFFQACSVAVDPPDLAAQTPVKVDVAIPAGLAVLGDFVAVIPPIDLSADLIFMGAYLTSDTNIKLCLHSIGAINDTERTWKFVFIPDAITDL